MVKRRARAHLQNRIILFLKHASVGSLAQLAKELQVHRSSVSRAMHSLCDEGYVSYENRRWQLTEKGLQAVQDLESELPIRTLKAKRSLDLLIEQNLFALRSTAPALESWEETVGKQFLKQANFELSLGVARALATSLAHTSVLASMADRLSSYANLMSKTDSVNMHTQNLASIVDMVASRASVLNALTNIGLANNMVDDLYSNILKPALDGFSALATEIQLPDELSQLLLQPKVAGMQNSLVEALEMPVLAAVANAIKVASVKPTIVELAAKQLLWVPDSYEQSVFAVAKSRLTQEALTSFIQSQQLSLSSFEYLSLHSSEATSLLHGLNIANIELSNIINDLQAVRLSTIDVPTLNLPLFASVPAVAEVARSYRGYVADTISGIFHDFESYISPVGLITSTRTTSDYIHSTRLALVDHEVDMAHVGHPREPGIGFDMDLVFEDIGPNYVTMWRGSWHVLRSDSPDRIRQAAHSGRELLMQTLSKMAPDSGFSQDEIVRFGHNGQVTRKMRIRKILSGASDSAVQWVESVAKALDETYSRLAAVSHDRNEYPQATEKQVEGLLWALGGLLTFLKDFYTGKNR